MDLLLELLEHLGLFIPVSLDDLFLLVEIGLVLEDERKLLLQSLNQVLHLFFETIALPGRKDEHMGHVGILEVIDIAEIVGDFPLYIHLFEDTFDRRKTTGAGQPGDKDVIADASDIKTQVNRFQGPLLADDLFAGFGLPTPTFHDETPGDRLGEPLGEASWPTL